MRIKAWLAEGPFRRLVRNSSILTAGNLGTALADLLSMALASRGLGATQFGVLALLVSFAALVSVVVKIQTLETVIRYGTGALARDDRSAFRRLVKLATTLEIGSAMVGAVLAILCIYLWGATYGLAPEHRDLAVLYAVVIAVNVVETPKAILRLFDIYTKPTLIWFSTAAARAGAVLVLFLHDADLPAYVLAWLITCSLEYVLLTGVAWLQMARNGYGDFMRSTLKGIGEEHPGWKRFVASTHASHMLTGSIRDIDILLVGALLGPAAAGIFKLAKQFGSIPTRLGLPIQQAVYPELAKLWTSGQVHEFRNMVRRVAAISGALGIIIWLVTLAVGALVIDALLGPEYAEVFVPLIVIMFGHVFYMLNLPLRPAILSVGTPGILLTTDIAMSIVFVTSVVGGVLFVGLTGAASAQVLLHVGAALVLWTHILSRLRRHGSAR